MPFAIIGKLASRIQVIAILKLLDRFCAPITNLIRISNTKNVTDDKCNERAPFWNLWSILPMKEFNQYLSEVSAKDDIRYEIFLSSLTARSEHSYSV